MENGKLRTVNGKLKTEISPFSVFRFPFTLVLLFTFFCSCSTDVELYDDYKDIPVIYGLLDVNADTNYIKITKAFCSDNDHPIDANVIALIYDSSNYPGKLDAFIEELKSSNNQPFQFTGRRFFLDTLTIHNKKEGHFYSPHQKLYYTTEHFNTNSEGNKYRYKLAVIKPEGDTATAETGIVNGNTAVLTSRVNFKAAPSNETSQLMFRSTEEATLYEIGMQFNYWEIRPGHSRVLKEVSWSYGTKRLTEYEKVEGFDDFYKLFYGVNTLFNALEYAIGNDTVMDVNHPNVIRHIGDFIVYISAAGEDFNNYYQFTQAMQNGLSLSTEYSNIDGGCGLFSSRILKRNTMELSSGTKYDLFLKPWGFQEN